jgi:hypothetical protein
MRRSERTPPNLPKAQIHNAPRQAFQLDRQEVADRVADTFERFRPTAHSFLAVAFGFWPLIAIVAMGIAFMWAGTLANSP